MQLTVSRRLQIVHFGRRRRGRTGLDYRQCFSTRRSLFIDLLQAISDRYIPSVSIS